MDVRQLQAALAHTGRYHGQVDGLYGPLTGAAVMLALTDGPDTVLYDVDYLASAARLSVEPEAIRAFAKVESAGAGFAEGRPVLLFEPHRFSRATNHRFDKSHPAVSYPAWDAKRYPRTQAGRYDQLLRAVGLDVDAGFASASYGKFQILGENYVACGYDSPFDFAQAMAFDEKTQLAAFEGFIRVNGLLPALKAKDWQRLARGYNGTAYAKNHYDTKLADAYVALKGQQT